MNVTVTGASGFLGTRLLDRLLRDGHSVHVLGRKRRQDLPPAVKFSSWDAMHAEAPLDSLAGADAVIHLAGEPVAQRWNADVKRRIRESRSTGTRHLVRAIGKLSRRPRVLVSASASGYYGDRGEEVLIESSAPGQRFSCRGLQGVGAARLGRRTCLESGWRLFALASYSAKRVVR